MVCINVSELLVEKFKQIKIKYVFGILSSGFIELGDILSETEIHYIGTRHEQWAGHIADVYGRLTGRPQVFLVPGGPGVTNAVTAIATANVNHSPVLVLSDGSTTEASGKYGFQDLDGTKITAPISKKSFAINIPKRIDEFLSLMYRTAITPLPGPVHLEIPRDVLLMKTNYKIGSISENIISKTYPKENDVINIINLLSKSTKPLIVAGEEINNPTGRELLEEFVNKMHIPVCSTHGNNDVLDNNSKYMLGAIGRLGSIQAMEAVGTANLIVSFGTSLSRYTFSPYYGFKYSDITKNVVQISNNPDDLGRTFPICIGISCDPVRFLELAVELIKNLNIKNVGNNQWFENSLIEEKKTFSGTYNNMIFETIFERIPRKVNISLDAGSMSTVMVKWKKYGASGRLITSGNMGEVGFSIPAAIGACLAIPHVPSFAFLGDGALTMQLSALITAVEYNVPIKVIVFDNSAWGSEKAYQLAMYEGKIFGSQLKNPKLVEVAKSIGFLAIEAYSKEEAVLGINTLINSDKPSLLVIKMEDDFPTPVRSLDAVKRVYRGIY